MKRRDQLRDRAVMTKSQEDWQEYREWRNKCKLIKKNVKESRKNLYETYEKTQYQGNVQSNKEYPGMEKWDIPCKFKERGCSLPETRSCKCAE